MVNSFSNFVYSLLPTGAERPLMAIGGTIGGVLSFVFGDISVLLYWLLIMAGLDLLTGTAGAMRQGTWRTSDFFVGITKKVLMFVFVALAHGVDVVFDHLLHHQIFQDIVICAYALCEFGSIIENFEVCGLGNVVPPVVKRALAAFNHRLDNEVSRIEDKEAKKDE